MPAQVSIILEFFDFASDSYLFAHNLQYPDPSTESLLVPWIIFFSLACLVSGLCLYVKVRTRGCARGAGRGETERQQGEGRGWEVERVGG